MLEILKIQNPEHKAFLKTMCVDVTAFGEGLMATANNMVKTMLLPNVDGHPQGVGLAAPQVGIGLNFFVMLTPEALMNNTHEAVTLVNPRLIVEYNDTEIGWEGCLSIPGVQGKVARHREVKVEYFDTVGAQHAMGLSAFAARVFQHEYDHLLGVLFLDRTTDLYIPKK